MKRFTLMLLVCFAAFGTTFGQDSEEEMMQKWQEALTPNENHAFLSQMEGDFVYTQKVWHEPGGEAEVVQGKTRAKMLFGGRYLEEFHTGNLFGMPFEGRNTIAYDNVSKEYQTHWMDNFGTGFMNGQGQRKENVLETFSTYPNIMMGGEDKYRTVVEVMSESEHTMAMYVTYPGGEEWKMMEITYTRK